MKFPHLLFLSEPQLSVAKAALADAGHEVATAAGTALTHALAAAPVGLINAARGAISAAEAPDKSGPQKLTEAIAAVTPEVLSYAAKGGVAAAEADAAKFAEMLIESELTSLATTKLGAIAGAILHLATAPPRRPALSGAAAMLPALSLAEPSPERGRA